MVHSTYSIKELKWEVEEDKVITSSAPGLPWLYSITQIGNEFEVVTIAENIDSVKHCELFMMCDSLENAKQKANEHHAKHIELILLKNIIFK